MSVRIETLVFCDGCDDNSSADDHSLTAKEIRKNRKLEGWIQVGSKDFCAECAVKRKEKKEKK